MPELFRNRGMSQLHTIVDLQYVCLSLQDIKSVDEQCSVQRQCDIYILGKENMHTNNAISENN